MKTANEDIAAATAGIPARSIEVKEEFCTATLGECWGRWQQRAAGWDWDVGVEQSCGKPEMHFTDFAADAAAARHACLDALARLDFQRVKMDPIVFKQEQP